MEQRRSIYGTIEMEQEWNNDRTKIVPFMEQKCNKNGTKWNKNGTNGTKMEQKFLVVDLTNTSESDLQL